MKQLLKFGVDVATPIKVKSITGYLIGQVLNQREHFLPPILADHRFYQTAEQQGNGLNPVFHRLNYIVLCLLEKKYPFERN